MTMPEGYRCLRVLSDRPGSRVFLAADESGRHCCLKVQRSTQAGMLEALGATRTILREISGGEPFIPLRRWGTVLDGGILWEEMELADDAMTGEAYSPRLAETYTPQTLAGWVREQGPLETERLLAVGIGLARGVAALHAAGLFHRDIKPTNVLVYQGRFVLGDYGSVGSPGSSIDFPGTEGYEPPDGLCSPALDVFALGRSLYEAWTGLDRFQFPSLPARVLGAGDWQTLGWQLNRILTRAADKRPSHRLPTAVALAAELEAARLPRRRLSRRQSLGALGGMLAAGVAAHLWRGRPPFKAVWRKLPPSRFGYENFHPTDATCDWASRTIYSIYGQEAGIHVNAVRMDDWSREDWVFPPVRHHLDRGVLVPGTGELWASEWVSGRVHRFGLQDKQMRTWEQEELGDLGFTGAVHWNPHRQRLGRFGGYGNFLCNNHRWEFDPGQRRWKRVEERSAPRPLPRLQGGQFQFAGPGGNSWFVFGGMGNASGRQSQRDPGLRGFDGHYHLLNDLWELDFLTDQWRQVLAPQAWMPAGAKAGLCHPGVGDRSGPGEDLLILLCGSEAGLARQAQFHWMHRDGRALPRPVPSVGGEIELFRLWGLLLDPSTRHLLVLADEGVFDVELVAA